MNTNQGTRANHSHLFLTKQRKERSPMTHSNQTHASSLLVCALALGAAGLVSQALAQGGVDLGGGTSMMKDLPFLQNLGSTAVDIMFLAAKIIGGFLAFVGVKNIGQRDWDRAIPALIGGTLLFFLPQIITALQKMGGAS